TAATAATTTTTVALALFAFLAGLGRLIRHVGRSGVEFEVGQVHVRKLVRHRCWRLGWGLDRRVDSGGGRPGCRRGAVDVATHGVEVCGHVIALRIITTAPTTSAAAAAGASIAFRGRGGRRCCCDGTELGVLKDLVVLIATAAVRAMCTFFAFGTHAGLDTIRAFGAIGTRSALAPGAFFTAPATTLAAFATLAIARALAVVTGGRLHGHGQGS